MKLNDLRYLCAVADHRHFGRAAEACFVSQPTLSGQLKKLEAELGLQLVERDNRQVALTSAGELIVRRARKVIQEADELKAFAQQLDNPLAGQLTLGVIPTICPYLLPHIVEPLQQQLPDLSIVWQELQSAECLQALGNGELDGAVLALPYEIGALQTQMLYSETFRLIVPPTRAISDNPVTIDELEQERLLLLDEGHCLRDQALEFCRSAKSSEHWGGSSDYRATSLETLRQLVQSGAGSTFIPELALRPADQWLPVNNFKAERQVVLVWRRTSARQLALQAVAKVIQQAVKPVLTH